MFGTNTFGTTYFGQPTASTGLSLARTASDTVSVSDSASRGGTNLARAGFDSVAVADVATRLTGRTRTSADTVTASDAATRAITRNRTASDAPGMVNVITNPSFEGGTAGWVGEGSSTVGLNTSSTATASIKYGTSVAKIICTGTVRAGGDGMVWSTPLTGLQGVPVSMSAWLSLGLAANLYLVLTDNAGETYTSALFSTVGGSAPTRVTLDVTPVGAGPFYFKVLTTTTNGRFFVDGAQVVPGATFAPDIIGSEPGSYWTGTPNASSSRPSADVATRAFANAPRTASDAVSASDVASGQTGWTRTAADTVTTSDSASRAARTSTRTASDAVSVGDAALRAALGRSRTAADNITASDAASRAFTRVRSAADSVSAADSATRALARTRSAADTVTRNDVATRAITRTRSASDTVARNDSASRLSYRSRTASDLVTASDFANAVVTYIVPTIKVPSMVDVLALATMVGTNIHVSAAALTERTRNAALSDRTTTTSDARPNTKTADLAAPTMKVEPS